MAYRPNAEIRPPRSAYTLFELLMVVALMAILAAVAIPLMDPAPVDSLQAAAAVLVADLDFARSLAVENGSTYRVTLNIPGNAYYVHHVGPSAALNTLPETALRSPTDPPDRQTTSLDRLPLGNGTKILGAKLATGTAIGLVEFTPLGATTQAANTEFWLSSGEGEARRYLSVTVLSPTGLTEVGLLTKSPPAGL